jgi:hypothetical protein
MNFDHRLTAMKTGSIQRDAALDYIATRIAPKFGVSVEVIAKRLRVETLWPPTTQAQA